jgi:hypothetical protein
MLPKAIVEGLAVSPGVLPELLEELDEFPALPTAVVDALVMLAAPPPLEQPDTSAKEMESISNKTATPRPRAQVVTADAVDDSWKQLRWNCSRCGDKLSCFGHVDWKRGIVTGMAGSPSCSRHDNYTIMARVMYEVRIESWGLSLRNVLVLSSPSNLNLLSDGPRTSRIQQRLIIFPSWRWVPLSLRPRDDKAFAGSERVGPEAIFLLPDDLADRKIVTIRCRGCVVDCDRGAGWR